MFDFVTRLDRLHALMEKESLPAYLVTHPIDLYYLTGQDLSRGKLLLTDSTQALIVDGRYFEACRASCSLPVFMEEENRLLSLLGKNQTLGVDSEHTTVDEYQSLKATLQKQGLDLRPVKSLVKLLRVFKDAEEVDLLRQAAELGSLGFDYVKTLIKEGIQESDLSLELELFWRRKGAEETAFPPIIAFGANSSMPHYKAGKERLNKNMPVLVDIGVTYNHYHSDMTRVIFYGEVHPKLKEIRGIVEEASERALEILKPGVAIGNIDALARSHISASGYGEFFTHSLGHGIGLEVHEFPTLKQNAVYGKIIVQEGMVFTIEPGIYLPGIGGVRLEDTVLITADGYENLTKRPK
jgi:Xaa-Pro aminopeptidase